MQPNMMKNRMNGKGIVALLERADVGALSTIGEDGYPYSAPVNFVYTDGKVYIHGRRVGEKIGNLERDPRVCFTVWERTGYEDCGTAACDTATVYESVIIRGKARIVEDVDLRRRVLLAMVANLVPDKTVIEDSKIPPAAVYRIEAESVTGKYHRPTAGNNVRRI